MHSSINLLLSMIELPTASCRKQRKIRILIAACMELGTVSVGIIELKA